MNCALSEKIYDCVVIGSGPGGMPFAWKLASKGMKVLILEAGKKYDPYKDYHLHENDWELKDFPKDSELPYSFGKKQILDNNYSHLQTWNKAGGKSEKLTHRKYYKYSHISGVGGTTLHFQGEAHRLNKAAFKIKSNFGIGQDWPINYDDIEKYYSEVENILGVAGPSSIPGRNRSRPLPLPPHQLKYASQVLEKSCKKLGYKLVPNSVAILSRPYRETPPCNYCNACTWGCPRKDKGSVDVTFLPMIEKTGNCEILTQAHASRIGVKSENGKKKAEGVYYFDKEGKENYVKARHIAVACGAVNTPRLLLNSELDHNGQVGKNFMETLHCSITGFHPDRLDSYRGIPIDGIIWDWNEPSSGKGGYRLYSSTGAAFGPLSYAKRFNEGWGEEFVKNVEKTFGHAITMAGIGEFLPNSNSFVKLSDSEKDRFGLPLAEINSELEMTELSLLDEMSNKAREILDNAGVSEYVEFVSSYDHFNATHVFGTCKMGDNPENSVVDSDLRSHEINNLYVTDASVFPSSGGGEAPSLTIEALSLRAADRLLVNLNS